MTAELYRGRSKTSSFQLEGEMVSGFNAGNRIGTGKRPCVYTTWFHLDEESAFRTSDSSQ